MRGLGWWKRAAACCLVVVGLAGCSMGRDDVSFSPDRYLVVWAGDADRKQTDFLAVIDADPRSSGYGKLLRTIPVKSAGNEPQDLNSELRWDRKVFATGQRSGRTFVFDLRDPLSGGLIRVDEPTGRQLAAPRAVATLPGGRVVVACADQAGYTGDPREVLGMPGGLRVLSNDGAFLRDLSAGGGMARGFVIAPSGIAVRPNLNVVVTTNQAHGFTPTTRGDLMPGITVQSWKLPALNVWQTIVLEAGPRGEENLGPRTPRFLRDRPFLYVNTHDGGALYVSDSVHTETPAFKLAYDFGAGSLPAGAAVTPDDRWYVTALPGANKVVSMDLKDPWHPKPADDLAFDASPDGMQDRQGGPSALAMALDGVRVAVADYTVDSPAYVLDGDRRVYVLRLDRATGALRFDDQFRDEVTGEVGVDFNRDTWPHGKTGPARPAAVLFVSPGRPEDDE